jgi:hypothetical protein
MSTNAASSAPVRELSRRESVKDHFMIWPLALACGFPILLVLAWAAPFDFVFLGTLLIISLWALATLVTLPLLVLFATRRSWRRAVSTLVFPLASVAAIASASSLWVFAIETGENIHFRVMRSRYMAHVASLPDAKPRLAVFNWGGFVISHAVVYDESDQLLLAPNDQSPEWKQRIAETELACGVWGTPVPAIIFTSFVLAARATAFLGGKTFQST